jgi:tRNA modification GTPase
VPCKYMDGDTIAAIVTPAGEGGVGVLRISGPEALSVLAKVFRDKHGRSRTSFETHKMYFGRVASSDGDVVDQVLAVAMLAPNSYTGEDVAELHCHSGRVVLRSVLELILEQGVRLAEPGEFTRRAFLNGRLDLAQAEAVADIVRAKTRQSLRLALSGLAGRLSAEVSTLRDRLIGVIAHIEAEIDFPEDDIDEFAVDSMRGIIAETISDLEGMIDKAASGRVYREGVSVVIAGRPNVGKSSIFNAIVKERRAIVTDVPGTTRDVIDEYVSLSGVPVRLMDTAGIRDTEDVVEREGVSRSRESLDQADVVLYVVDASSFERGRDVSEDERTLANIPRDRTILVLNKIDLIQGIVSEAPFGELTPSVVVKTSAVTGSGLDELENQIFEMVVREDLSAGEAVVTNVRHEDALRRAKKHLEDALSAADRDTPLDLVVIDMRQGLNALGEITGETVDEDIIDRIFADFCVGK